MYYLMLFLAVFLVQFVKYPVAEEISDG